MIPLDNRRAMIAIAIAVAFLAIVVPTCRMVGCSMTTAGTAWTQLDLPGFFGTCGGTFVTSNAPAAVVPSDADGLVLALVGMLLVALLAFESPRSIRLVVAPASGPPPPPQDPRGERLLV